MSSEFNFLNFNPTKKPNEKPEDNVVVRGLQFSAKLISGFALALMLISSLAGVIVFCIYVEYTWWIGLTIIGGGYVLGLALLTISSLFTGLAELVKDTKITNNKLDDVVLAIKNGNESEKAEAIEELELPDL